MAAAQNSRNTNQPATTRRAAAEQRRKRSQGGRFRMLGLLAVTVGILAGALYLAFSPWQGGGLNAAPPTEPLESRPFSLSPGNVVITSNVTATDEAVTHSETPRPTASDNFNAPDAQFAGKGTFKTQSVADGDSGRDGRTITYSVSVEEGVEFDANQANAMVRTTLSDPRGWETKEKVHFVQVGEGEKAEVEFIFASPATTNKLCYPLDTGGEYSCSPNGSKKVVLNVRSWLRPIEAYKNNTSEFESMVINHAVGYTLGKGSEKCPGAGKPAPIMLAQTINMEGCAPNAWPSVA